MMKTLEQGSKKIKKICDALKEEAIEPAKKLAEEIVEEAKLRAHEIIKEAEAQAERIQNDAKVAIDQERNVFQSTLVQAARLSVESLKQDIEHHVFSKELPQLIDQQMADPKIIARLINAIITAIEKEGLSTDITAIVPKNINQKEINQLLGEQTAKKLKEEGVMLGDFTGGAKVKLHQKKITIDISDKALLELFAGYAPGFRKFFFAG